MGGVTITGSLAGSGSADGSTNGATSSEGTTHVVIPAGLTVTAVGTGVSATVDPAGQFVLRQLPSGNIQLRFTAVSTSATLTLEGLEAGQQVTIVINLTNSSAAVGATSNAGEPPAAINTTYAPTSTAWLKPLNILQARYFKFGAQFNF